MPSEVNANALYAAITARLAEPAFRHCALYERFRIARSFDQVVETAGYLSFAGSAIRDGLRAQGWGYTLQVMGQGNRQIALLGSVPVAAEDPTAVVVAVADPRLDIISATVREQGYCLCPNGALRLHHPAIAHDLSGSGLRTAIGLMAHGLARRTAPVTLLCCDNMTANGDTHRQAVYRFATAAGLVLDRAETAFSNDMVDRITLATTEALRKVTGDPVAVSTQRFRAWVIEGRFVRPRPNWPDVHRVADAAPYELRNLRLLNGAIPSWPMPDCWQDSRMFKRPFPTRPCGRGQRH